MSFSLQKILSGALILTGVLFGAMTVFAQESVDLFQIEAVIQPDATVEVAERIEYNFGDNERRGIFRDIPLKYRTSTGRRSIDIDLINVTRNGRPEPSSLTGSGGEWSVRIGDPNIYISGVHTYEISYLVDGAMNYFADFDEWYWNVTGDGWEVPIKRAGARVSIAGSQPTEIACFQGPHGSNEPCQITPNDVTAITNTSRELIPGEGFTVAVAFPKGVVYEPTAWERFTKWVSDNWIVFLPVVVFIGMFRWWWVVGRDPKPRQPVIAMYEPPRQLRPTLAGVLLDGKLDYHDVTAGIVYLAEQGYLTITHIAKKGIFGSTDYELKFIKELGDEILISERDILEMVFGGLPAVNNTRKLSEIKKDTSMQSKFQQFRKDTFKIVTDDGWYVRNPISIMTNTIVIGIIVVFVLDIIGGVFLSPLAIAMSMISGVIIVVFGILMPKRTPEGVALKQELKGFKEFLSVTDKERFAFHNAPQQSPQQFMEYLPYAIAFRVEKQWAKQFKDMYLSAPDWYRSNMATTFVATDFLSDLSGFTGKINSGFSAAASGSSGSGGGGFSGGGAWAAAVVAVGDVAMR